jgi:hypothetical protein
MGFVPESGIPRGAEIHLLAQPLAPSASVEIMRSGAAYPVKPRRSDSTESLVVPLINQFNLMQQQMFDQFQQAMSMLVQMFGKMHRDQMDVIRMELDRLHELTQEFQSLKDELAKRTQDPFQAVPPEARRAPAVSDPAAYGRRESLTGFSPAHTPVSKSQTRTADKPSASSAAGQPGSRAFSPLLPQSGAPGDELSDKLHPAMASDFLSSGGSAAPPTSEQSQAVGARFPNSIGDSGSAADTDKDTIIWLHQRIMSIQSERESRWQKILKLLPGVS